MNRYTASVLTGALWCLACAVFASRALAGADSVSEPLHWAPADADAVFVLRDGGETRRTPLGLAGERALLGLLVGADQTRDAWQAFAATLGFGEPEAFDALLGTRLVIVARGFWSPETPTEWAVVSDIDRKIESRIRERIASPPREVIGGMPVFSLEQGRFSLLREERTGEDGARIVIAPTRSMKLLRSIALGMAEQRGPNLASTPAAARLLRLGDGDALGLVRFPDGIGGWWGGVASFTDQTATASFVTGLAKPMSPPKAWSIDAWRNLGEASALLFVEQLMADDEADPQGLDGFFATVTEAIAPVLESGQVERGALVIAPREGAGLEIAGALHGRDAIGAASDMDDLMQRVSGSLGADEAPDFGGMFPTSERQVAIGKAGLSAFVLGPTPIDMIWRLHLDDEGPAGWWVAATSKAVADRIAEATAQPAGGEQRPWLSYGFARPNLLIDRAGSTGLPIPVVVQGFAGVATIEWWSWMEAPTEMLGRIEITAMPDPAGF